jgi:putative phage-type endonuclease
MNEQRTPEWFTARLGKITASRIGAVLARPRKGSESSLTRDNYRAQLILERITGIEKESGFQSKAMERGIELEPEARALYDTVKNVMVEPVGFIQHPTIANAGCSPDGLVGDDGMVQFKCPYPATHIEWLTRGGVPTEHRRQMAFELSCFPERKWSDFVSYCPDMPDHLRLFVARMWRDAMVADIEDIEREVLKFDAEIEEAIKLLPNGKTLEENLERSIHAVKAKRNPEAELGITHDDANSLKV